MRRMFQDTHFMLIEESFLTTHPDGVFTGQRKTVGWLRNAGDRRIAETAARGNGWASSDGRGDGGSEERQCAPVRLTDGSCGKTTAQRSIELVSRGGTRHWVNCGVDEGSRGGGCGRPASRGDEGNCMVYLARRMCKRVGCRQWPKVG